MSRSRFLFHAYAAGLSGKIHRPYEETLEVQAPSALPPSGGVSNGSSKGVKVRDFLQCDSVVSRSTGEFQAATGTYETRVTAAAEQFNLGGVVTADLVRAQVHSSHSQDEKSEPSIVPEGSAIINLRVLGTLIEFENLSDLFTELNTMTKLRDRHKENPDFRTRIHEYTMVVRFAELAENHLHRYFPFCRSSPQEELHETRHAAILPLFRVLTPSGPGFKVVQNVIHIENFGRLHLGELIVTPTERRVTAVHVDLGSPTGGHFTVCSVGANGGQTDPPPDGGR